MFYITYIEMKKNRCRKRPVRTIIIAVILTAGITVSALTATHLFGRITNKDSVLYVPEGTTFNVLLDSLNSGGKIESTARFSRVAKAAARDKEIHPGRYELKSGMSTVALIRKIYGGHQSPVKITFNNIRNLPQLASYLGNRLEADSASFASVLLSDSTASTYGFTGHEFIGMFIPDTYELYWTTKPEAFIKRINEAYMIFWNKNRQSKLKRTGLTSKEVSTLASIVEEETNKSDEMPVIAGTYLNRLRKGMKLQADPTVKFAIGDFSLKRIMHKHLDTDSPYNTYRHEGLPPGPIRMPSATAIDAVLNYDENDYIYFCARSDFSGYHSFAKTYSEHLRNARNYSAALNRAGIK